MSDIDPVQLRREIADAQSVQLKVPDQTVGIALSFEAVPLPGFASSPDAVAHVAVDQTGDGSIVKLIVHVKSICFDDMARFTAPLNHFSLQVLHELPGRVEMEVGESPVFRQQWDCCIWGVPTMRGPGVKQLLIQLLRTTASESRRTPAPW